MNDECYVVMKLDKDTEYWDQLSVKLTLEKAKWFRNASESTYKGCKFMIVKIIEE